MRDNWLEVEDFYNQELNNYIAQACLNLKKSREELFNSVMKKFLLKTMNEFQKSISLTFKNDIDNYFKNLNDVMNSSGGEKYEICDRLRKNKERLENRVRAFDYINDYVSEIFSDKYGSESGSKNFSIYDIKKFQQKVKEALTGEFEDWK